MSKMEHECRPDTAYMPHGYVQYGRNGEWLIWLGVETCDVKFCPHCGIELPQPRREDEVPKMP